MSVVLEVAHWSDAESRYVDARASEAAYWGQPEAAGAFDNEEGDRLIARRCVLEEELMEMPSPNVPAFARKVLIALSDDREWREDWVNQIVSEARELAGA